MIPDVEWGQTGVGRRQKSSTGGREWRRQSVGVSRLSRRGEGLCERLGGGSGQN